MSDAALLFYIHWLHAVGKVNFNPKACIKRYTTWHNLSYSIFCTKYTSNICCVSYPCPGGSYAILIYHSNIPWATHDSWNTTYPFYYLATLCFIFHNSKIPLSSILLREQSVNLNGSLVLKGLFHGDIIANFYHLHESQKCSFITDDTTFKWGYFMTIS